MIQVQMRSTASRLKVMALYAALGVALGAIAIANHHVWLGAFGIVWFVVVAGFISFSRSEWAEIQGPAADERQKSIDLQAAQVTLGLAAAVAVVGFFTEFAHGRAGAFTLMSAVIGFGYWISLAVLRHRR